MDYVSHFFAGAFLCNCIPHLVSGLQGKPFPSPLAKPPGVGDSSPLVNVFWGMFNLLAGLFLLAASPVHIELSLGFLSFVLGAVSLGSYVAVHFGNVMSRRRQP